MIMILHTILMFFVFQPGNPANPTKEEHFAPVYLYLCNETRNRASFAIVYQSGFGIFSDNWDTKGNFEVAPGDCAKVLITTWGSKIGKGYIRASFKQGDKFVAASYSNHNSSRREHEEFSVVPNDASLCLPVFEDTYDTEISKNTLMGDCGILPKTKFNFWFNQSSNVYEMNIYFQESGIQTSYKSSHREGDY